MLNRRGCLRFVAGSVVVGIGDRAGQAQPAAMMRDVRFRLLRGGSSIGTHAVVFRQDGARTIVTAEIAILVRVAFINAFRFRHSSEEVFEGGRLTSLRSTTNDDGLMYGVTGRAAREGFRMEGSGGPFIAPATLLTTNCFWDPAFVRQQALINSQQGGQVGLAASRFGAERMSVRGTQVETVKYRAVMPYCAGYIWYSAEGRWVHAELEMRGETIEYVVD
jgi:hypothetical protein